MYLRVMSGRECTWLYNYNIKNQQIGCIFRAILSTIHSVFLPPPQDLGVFIPATMAQGMRMDFFLEGPFMPNRMKMETLGGLADMFGQMPGRCGLRLV